MPPIVPRDVRYLVNLPLNTKGLRRHRNNGNRSLDALPGSEIQVQCHLQLRRTGVILQELMLHSRMSCAVTAVAFGASVQSSTAQSPRALGPD